MTTWTELVAEHTDHWLRFDGPDAVKCHTCSKDPGRRILLPLRPDLAATPAPLALHAADRCTTHPGQRAGTCGACRADAIADRAIADVEPPEEHVFTADETYAIGAAAARAALAQVAARRRGDQTKETT